MPTETAQRYWRPNRFDFHLLMEMISVFLGAGFFVIFILLTFQGLRLAEFFVIHGVSLFTLLKLASLMILSFLPTALPFAFLMSVLVTFGRLSADSELVALKSSGFSTLRLVVPVTVFAAFIVIISLFLNITWVPWGSLNFKKTIIKISNTKAVTAVKEGTFTTGFFNLLIFADKVDSAKNRLHHVFIYDEREPKSPMAYISKKAEITPVKTDTEFGSAIMLKLYDGSMHQNNIEENQYDRMDFDSYQLYLKVDEGADTTLLKPQMIPQDDLNLKIKTFPIETYEGREFRGEYWRRASTALSPLVFALLGVLFGSFRHRGAKTSAIMTGFGILIVYWVLQGTGTALLQRGTVSPVLAMNFPNLLFLLIGAIGLKRVAW